MSGDPIQRLIHELGRLPGIGERSATRLAFYIIKSSRASLEASGKAAPKSLAHDLSVALIRAVEDVSLCARCQNLCASELCSICRDPNRDPSVVCVVEGIPDLRAIETSGAFRGVYHVLHGALAPLDGIGPQELRIDKLMARITTSPPSEVILATNSDVEGDATALYLAQLIKPLNVRTTRLASGIPLGGELEYVDQATLGRAVNDRRTFGE